MNYTTIIQNQNGSVKVSSNKSYNKIFIECALLKHKTQLHIKNKYFSHIIHANLCETILYFKFLYHCFKYIHNKNYFLV